MYVFIKKGVRKNKCNQNVICIFLAFLSLAFTDANWTFLNVVFMIYKLVM